MVKFSVIIPVYNVEKYLKKCVESVLSQGYKEYEIILINDGSTDSSGEICSEYARLNKNIKVINKKNGGLSDARNVGIVAAKGEYIIFVDSDDWMMDNALVQIANIVKTEKPDIVMNRVASYSEDINKIQECEYNFLKLQDKSLEPDKIFKNIYRMKGFWGAAWMFVVSKEYLFEKELFFMKGILHEDEEWAPRVILNSTKIAFNEKCFYCNRKERIGSITQTPNIKKEFDKLKIIEKLIIESKKNIYSESMRRCLKERSASLFLGVIINCNIYKSDTKYNELVKDIKKMKYILKISRNIKYKSIYLYIKIFKIEWLSKILMR